MCLSTWTPEVNGRCEEETFDMPEDSGNKDVEMCNDRPCDASVAHCQEIDGQSKCICLESLKEADLHNGCSVPTGEHQNDTSGVLTRSHLLGVLSVNNGSEVINPKISQGAGNQTVSILRTPADTWSSPQQVALQVIPPISLVLFIVLLISLLCLRRHRQNGLRSKRGGESVVKNGDGVLLLDRMNNINKNPTYFVSSGEDSCQKKFFIREIAMDHIVLVDVVGEGAFGQVYRGELFFPDTDTQQLVAVKVLKENVSHEIREDFEREVEIMAAFDHDNILKLIGVVSQNAGQSPYMIFEYMVHGDLAELLRKNDPLIANKEENVIHLQKPDLVDIATQIANGMRYLTSQHFVHRDLATRNCLVGERLVVKISDFGMSRDIYTCDYYKIGGSRMLPVRWMSPESVKYGRFTSESDAWAYGVVLWEIFSSGRQPYYGHSNEEVIRFLDAGILLQRPEDCPSTVYHIMLGCWKADPKERLSFDKIHKHLHDYHQRLVKMIATQAQQQNRIDEEIKLPPSPLPDRSPDSNSLESLPSNPPTPHIGQVPESVNKSQLKACVSDPQAKGRTLGDGKMTSWSQHRVQPKPDLQSLPQIKSLLTSSSDPPQSEISLQQLKPTTLTDDLASINTQAENEVLIPIVNYSHPLSTELSEVWSPDCHFSPAEINLKQQLSQKDILSSDVLITDSPSRIICSSPVETV